GRQFGFAAEAAPTKRGIGADGRFAFAAEAAPTKVEAAQGGAELRCSRVERVRGRVCWAVYVHQHVSAPGSSSAARGRARSGSTRGGTARPRPDVRDGAGP